MQHWSKRFALVLALLGCLFLLTPGTALAAGEMPIAETATKSTKLGLNATAVDFYVGGIYKLKLGNVSAKKIKWKSSKPSIATVSKKGTVKAKRIGTCTVAAKYKGKTYKCKIFVLSDEKYLNTWCKSMAKQIKYNYSSPYDRVLAATWYVNTHFSYGRSSTPFEVLTAGKGTCVSANKLLVEMLKALGFKAKVRFAANDKMKRYPPGVIFGSDHHNVKVTIKGKTYYVDATPESGCIYMSTSKKNIYLEFTMPGDERVVVDKVPKA